MFKLIYKVKQKYKAVNIYILITEKEFELCENYTNLFTFVTYNSYK